MIYMKRFKLTFDNSYLFIKPKLRLFGKLCFPTYRCSPRVNARYPFSLLSELIVDIYFLADACDAIFQKNDMQSRIDGQLEQFL